MRPTRLRTSLVWLHLMNILLLGSGGREHALAWKIAASPLVTKLWCAPGNAGIAREAECVALDIADHAAVIDFCKAQRGRFRRGRPGCADRGRHRRRSRRRRLQGVRADQGGGQLESSKSFTKALCRANNIPTAAYEHFTDADDALAYVRAQGAPIVVKADGLAAGKGVVVAMTEAEALAAIDMMFGGGFGAAGAEVVIEEFMAGRGSLVLRAVRRRARAAAGDRAGPQARLRRRQGAEHRRHGRLFAGAGRDAKRSARG